MKSTKPLNRMILSVVLFTIATPIVAQDSIPWLTDLRQARELAERQNRLVLLHFWGEGCIPCEQVERNVFNKPAFIRAITTGYIPVKINAGQQPQYAEFYNIERVPTDVIVTPEGREVQRFQSLQDSNQYIAMLDGIRAQANVGNYNQVETTRGGVAAQLPQNSGSSQAGGSRYGQNHYGQQAVSQPALPPADSTPDFSQNRYSNPLEQHTAPQQQELARRYANPYGQQATENANAGGSRWGQTPPANGSGQSAQPQDNQFSESPISSAGNSTYGVSKPWQQDPGAGQNGVARNDGIQNGLAQNPNVQTQPAQNPIPGGTALQQGYSANPPTQPVAPQPQANSNPSQFSLEGYCPVTLVQNRVWTPGDKKWGAIHDGRTYLFAGPEQQKQFLANPHVYAPLMSGHDPVRFAETGQLVPGRREFGLYIDEPGPIALFADEAALTRFHANSAYYFNVIRQAKVQQAGHTTR